MTILTMDLIEVSPADQKILADSLKQLRYLVEKDSDLNNGKILDDKFLRKFIYTQNYDANKAYNHIKGYFHLRKSNPEMYVEPSKVMDVFKERIFSILPQKGSSGETIVYIRCGNWDPSKFDPIHLIKGQSVVSFDLIFNT